MAHGEKQLGGYFVEKACHTAGIMQLLAGAVTGTSGGPGQAADIKRIHRTNGLWLGAFTLGQQLCRYRPQAGRGVSRYLVGRTLFRFANYPVLCGMENEYLNMLARIVLPAQILDYFTIAGVSQTSTEIHISLDEKMSSELSSKVHFESKGFMEPVSVTDFPIRDHKVILRIRRRRWTDLRTGKSFSLPIDLDVVAKGTRYSKEFGAFLKETYGDIPRDLPYA